HHLPSALSTRTLPHKMCIYINTHIYTHTHIYTYMYNIHDMDGWMCFVLQMYMCICTYTHTSPGQCLKAAPGLHTQLQLSLCRVLW
uniref:Uncharacterized protein n=1 Tax=Coturnix japonica TaxID=93934 RepID=A0A8C2Y984_COTJA